MKDLDRGKNLVPPHASIAHNQGQLRQDLESAQKENYRLQDEREELKDEKEELAEKLEQETTERLGFQQRLEQAMQDLEVSEDEKSQAIAVRDQAISSRNSAIGRLGGLTAHRNRLREKVETLDARNESLKNSLKLAMEQVIGANQQREAFQEAYQKVKAAYQNLKLAHQNLKIDQQNSHVRIEKLKTDFARLKTGCKKLKVEYEKLLASHAQDFARQDMSKIVTAYREMSFIERSQLPSELKLLLDQLEGNYPG
ncbi:MAG: hypothetical protein LH647_07810 [Leptolyngbyaceae cyanobacterium CAN_BIN12]|nr:hypothetical protein [Leptolyngbyaceae cyanobacterium CAN_BIN12]